MSPARQHRERHSATAADAGTTDRIDQLEEGGQSDAASQTVIVIENAMTPAAQHRLLRLGAQLGQAVAAADAFEAETGNATSLAQLAAGAVNAAQREVNLRLIHDLRRLKMMESIVDRIPVKREMLPHYDSWVAGLLAAERETGKAVQEDVLPTVMIWRIDTGDYHGALDLAEYVLRHDIVLPARYNRKAATLIAEEIADAAMKPGCDGAVTLDILDRVDELVDGRDMHDQVRAKLMKAIGLEAQRLADAAPEDPAANALRVRALAALRRAQQLDDRVGVKGRITAIEKLLDTAPPAPPPAPDVPPAPDAASDATPAPATED